MKQAKKLCALALALCLLLSLAGTGMTVRAEEGLTQIVLDGYSDNGEIFRILDLVNQARAEAGVPKLSYDPTLGRAAGQRAAECYVYYSHTRPNGSDFYTVLNDYSGYDCGSTGENIAMGQPTADQVMDAWMHSEGHRANILHPEYRSMGIGMFYQPDGQIAWTQLFHTNQMPFDIDFSNDVVEAKTYVVEAAPENMVCHVAHHTFNGRYCALDLYEGMTIGSQLQLVNPGNPYADPVEAEFGEYTYVSSDESVFTVDNEKRTITAVGPGTAELSVQFHGKTVYVLDDAGYYTDHVTVQVSEMPSLSYEIDARGTIHIDYSGFFSGVDLFYRGNHDDMWTMGNREGDLVYEHYNPDPTDTYVYVMRYFDIFLNADVEVGQRLIVQLGDEEPTVPDPSDPTEPSEPEEPEDPEFRYPTADQLPAWDREPTVEEICQAIGDFQEKYPAGTILPAAGGYHWQGGIDGPDQDLEAISDLLFGTLPARTISDATVEDIRPGDLISADNGYHNMLVTEVTPDYVYGISVTENLYGDYILSTKLLPAGFVEIKNTTVYTRYESTSPGAASFGGFVLPEGVRIIAGGDLSSVAKDWNGNVTAYSTVIYWELDDQGTLYIHGKGSFTNTRLNGWGNVQDKVKNVIISDRITGIGYQSFQKHRSLETVTMGADVQEIGMQAFSGCTALTGINLSEGLTSISDDAFADCTALTGVSFPDGLESIGENAFSRTSLTHAILPDGVTGIGGYAFSSCEKLTQARVPATVTEMGDGVFASCKNLTDLELAEGLTTLGSWSFCTGCSSLTTVTIPQGITTIGSNAFLNCYSLKELHLPNSLTTISDQAFMNCTAVTDVYFYGSESQWNAVQIGDWNDPFDFWKWPPVNMHYLDPNACRHSSTQPLPGYAPTCTEPGLTEGKVCADCGEVITAQEVIPATGHSHEVLVTAPTCTEQGYTTYTCHCGDSYVSDYMDALGHDWVGYGCTRCGATRKTPFDDVIPGQFYEEPVAWAVANGITSGASATEFNPGGSCLRAQVVTFLHRAEDNPEPANPSNPFTDVKTTDFFYKPVLWAVEKGITNGTSATTFGSYDVCNRAAVVTFLWRTAGSPEPASTEHPFTDVPAGAFYEKAVLWAIENGITNGISATEFGPTSPCNRAQVVTFLYRANN